MNKVGINNSANPRVSVLMSVYNGEKYLRESIESILNQTFTDFEFLIINDGSLDSSREIVLSYNDPRIRLIDNPINIGLAKSLNKGLDTARGEFIARQDADDISCTARLEKQAAFLQAHPEVAVLGTQALNIDEQGSFFRSFGWERSLSEIGIRWLCMFESPFIHSSVMMRCSIVRDEYAGYNPDYKTSQDHELWTRIVYGHTCRNLNEQLLYLRGHSKSVSSNYTVDAMERVAATLRQAAFSGLGQGPSEGWVEQWIRINNPQLYPEKLDIGRIIRMIDEMHGRFVDINRMDKEKKDILHQKHRIFARIAYNAVNTDKAASFVLFLRVCRNDIKVACAMIPKYIAAFMLGKQAVRLYRSIKVIFKSS